MGVIFTTLLLMAVTMLGAFKSVGFSRQRTQATTLANQALEQIRALPADQLLLSRADSAADLQLLPTGCLTSPSGACTFHGRTVPTATLMSAVATPLAPQHIVTTTGSPGLTNYTVASYITVDPTDSSGQTRIATIQVSWDHAQQGGLSASVQVESKLHTSPFTVLAPGTHSYTASALTTAGTISVTGKLLNQAGLNIGFPLPSTNAYYNGGISGTNVGSNPGVVGNQVSAGIASSTVAGVVNTGATAATQYSMVGDGARGPSPQTSAPGVPFSILGAQSTGVSLLSGNLSGAAGSVTVADAVAASQAQGQSGILSETLPTNKLGYGSSQASQSGAISANLLLVGLLNTPLVQLTPTGNSNPDRSTVTQNGTLAAPSQSFTATANKSFSSIDVLGGLLIPVVHVQNYKASASACASPTAGLCSPSTAVSQGQVQILGGTPIDLLGHVAGNLALTATTVNIGLAALTIGVNVTAGSTLATSPGSGTVSSPLKIDVTLKIVVLGTTVVDLDIKVDLGDVITTAAYS